MQSDLKYIIVTNTINRSAEIVSKSLVRSLNQEIKPIKVILIDQNDNPIPLPDKIINNPIFERQSMQTRAVSSARNGLLIPDGADWIFFCDDDGYPDVNYSTILQAIITNYQGIEIIAGKIIREDTNEHYTIRQKNFGSLKKFRYTKKLMGSNFVIRVSVFNNLGRFDDNFGAGSYWGSSEETDFCWKAYFGGINQEYFPELKVFHLPPFQESVKQGFGKSFRYGIGKGALVWKWLIKKKKIIVLFEFTEMLIVPIIQIVRGIFILKPQLIPNNIATFSGRVLGFIKAFFIRKF